MSETTSGSVDSLMNAYDRGLLSRRTLLTGLTALLASNRPVSAATTGAQEPPRPTFSATGLDHIALAVSDPQRSSAFYQRHLGLRVTSSSANSVFLSCGEHFVALFRNKVPGLAHYSFALSDYRQEFAAERLRSAGIEPRLRGNRTYFDDPDGIEVQVSRA